MRLYDSSLRCLKTLLTFTKSYLTKLFNFQLTLRTMDDIDDNLDKISTKINELPAVTKQQDKRDLLEFQARADSVDSKMEQTVKGLHEAADKIDDVWRDCKIAYAFGTSFWVISLGAMVMTGGVASPLVYAGLGLGLGSLGINLGTSKIETAINSAEVEKAEKLLKETLDSIDKVQQLITNWLNKKEIARIVYICLLAKHLKVEKHVMNLLSVVLSFRLGSPASMSTLKTAEMIMVTAVSREGIKATAKTAKELGAQFADDFVQAAGTAGGAQVADDVVQAAGGVGGATATARGGKVGALVGGFISKALIVVNVALLMYDVIYMGFTIRDLINNKGSDASKCLREMANQLKKTMTKQRNSQQIPGIDVCETLLDKQYFIEEIS